MHEISTSLSSGCGELHRYCFDSYLFEFTHSIALCFLVLSLSGSGWSRNCNVETRSWSFDVKDDCMFPDRSLQFSVFVGLSETATLSSERRSWKEQETVCSLRKLATPLMARIVQHPGSEMRKYFQTIDGCIDSPRMGRTVYLAARNCASQCFEGHLLTLNLNNTILCRQSPDAARTKQQHTYSGDTCHETDC